jgi:hypothetical protein
MVHYLREAARPVYEADRHAKVQLKKKVRFGSYRYHERWASGRKVASPGTVVRDSVRLVASAATRLGPVDGADLAPSDRTKWRLLRGTLDGRQATRTLGRRFRLDPAEYLRSIEESLIKKTLPS